MPEQVTQNIQFKHQKSKQSNPAQMFTLVYSDKEQKTRALKTLFTYWLVAAGCVLIPIAHFILVPLFFVLAIVKATKLWSKKVDGLNAKGVCPACNNEVSFNLDKNPELPQWFDCPECGKSLELHS